MKKLKTFEELLVHELQDLYSAEKQVTKSIPKLIKHVESPTLKDAFNKHLKQTEMQLERLDKAFDLLNATSRGAKCSGMAGIIEEENELLDMDGLSPLMDAAIIGAAQRVEHYEIAGYGVARTFANLLGHTDVAELLDETLKEEKETDALLTEIAETEINVEAKEASAVS